MNLPDLKYELKQMLDTIFSICSSCDLSEIVDQCLIWQSELDNPLKIAIVGITSAGKSTLLNALTKRFIVPTGAETLTYNVNVLRHISRSPYNGECIIVHMKDGTDEYMPISELTKLVDGRDPKTSSLRQRIYWVEAFIDYDYLQEIDLIDTPGLLSIQEDDSKNTIRLFNDEERRPDVFIYLMQQKVTKNDVEAVKSFRDLLGSKSTISGLNTIAALTHCDYYSKDDFYIDFHKEAEAIIENNRKQFVDFRSCFSKAFTLAAIYAQSAYAMSADDFCVIQKLKDKFYDELLDNLYTKSDFVDDESIFGDIINGHNNRLEFINRIDMAVIKYSIWWLDKNSNATLENLREELISKSGVKNLDEYVFSKFKRLAIFFKALKLVTNLRKSIEKSIVKQFDSKRLESLERILIICRNFEVKLLSHFSFLSVLVDYYNGASYFNIKEWGIALQTIEECLSETPNKSLLSENRNYLLGRKNYYSILSDIEAIESCEKLITQINLTL